MPRTPLLRALRRLADEHRAADRLGIPVAELQGRRAEDAAYDRGEFLKRAGVAGAGMVAGSAYFAEHARAARGATGARIAIIGGGIAGLTAALTLQDKGVYADVYESSGRIGGRMHSDWTEFGPASGTTASRPSCAASSSTRATRRSRLSRTASISRWSTCSRRNRAAPTTRTGSSAADYTTAQAAADFKPRQRDRSRSSSTRPAIRRRTTAPRRPARCSTRCRCTTGSRTTFRAGSARSSARCSTPPTTRSTARRRPTSRRSTSSTCSATSRRRLQRARAVRRALPHRRRQLEPADRDRELAAGGQHPLGYRMSVDRAEQRRLDQGHVLERDVDHRRPGDPVHELLGAADARLLEGRLRPRSSRRRSRSSARATTRS